MCQPSPFYDLKIVAMKSRSNHPSEYLIYPSEEIQADQNKNIVSD
jgi:hypothetical protein